ncbi:uncharacterized protein METZ01_LOCUS214625 [marine metagenome]|uniref:Uncharacterized protein n=1 Tax=marine metagenome TaxID=408172 RepID=A0A382FIF4_9ZZZZ
MMGRFGYIKGEKYVFIRSNKEGRNSNSWFK